MNLKANDVLGRIPERRGFSPFSLLEETLELQGGLLKFYIQKGSLPQFPIGIGTKAEQEVFRGIAGAFTEELSEFYTSYTTAYELWSTPKKHQPELAADAILEYNEELADSMHFAFELLIYANLNWENIDRYVRSWALDNGLPHLAEPQPGTSVFDRLSQITHLLCTKAYGYSFAQTGSEYLYPGSSRTEPIFQGNRVGDTTQDLVIRILWENVHLLNRAMNLLKAKKWVENPLRTKPEEFQEAIVQWFMSYMGLLITLGHTPESINYTYRIKNYINHERIKAKY